MFLAKPFYIIVFKVYAPTTNAEEVEVERFDEGYKTFRTNTKKRYPSLIGDWNAKAGNQETRGVTGKFGLGV